MPTVPSNGIELCYEDFGDPDDPTLLMIMGLGAQMVVWDEELCRGFVDRGFHVVRFDNRDVGGSTWLDGHEVDPAAAMMAALGDGHYPAPYLLADMAADAVGLLDALGVDAAHLLGCSMGGMIAQTLALEHPERVRSLTSVMSCTEVTDVAPTPEVLEAVLQPPATDREGAIEQGVRTRRALAGAEHLDEERMRTGAALAYDRGYNPPGTMRQLVAIACSPPRTEALAAVEVPTFVVHGDADPLVALAGGHRTADAVPGAELLVLEGMGHDVAPFFWAPIIEGVTRTAARVAAEA